MSDINELAIRDAKRSLLETEMDIDDDVATKKRRN